MDEDKRNVIGVISAVSNITKQKSMEEELKKYKKIIDNVSDLVYICDTKGNILFANKIFYKFTGYKSEDFYGKSFSPLFDEENLEKAMDVYTRTLEGESPEYELRFKDTGILCEYKNLPLCDDEENIIGVVGIARDITERKSIENTLRESEEKLKILNERLEQRVEERTKKFYKENTIRNKIEVALRESEKKFQDLYENLPDMYVSIDVKTAKVIQCNKTLAKKLDYKVKEIVGKESFFLYHPDCIEEAKQIFQKFINTGEINNAELQMMRKDGSKMEVLLNATAFRNKDGKILYSRSIFRDITERKSLQEELIDQKSALEKKNIALGEILGQLEIEKKQIKDNVVANAENLLLPIIQKLKLTGEAAVYVQLLQKNLEELVSSFGSKLIANTVKLTTREIEICNMVKNGLTNKEIAKLLVISLGTTKRHRNNIRRKIGIINTDMNLASFLNSK